MDQDAEHPLAQGIRRRMRELDLGPDARPPALRRRIAELSRELEEVEQRIPFWDRLLVFSTTPDEGALDPAPPDPRRAAPGARGGGGRGRKPRAARAQCPPFALGLELERALRTARKELEVAGVLFRAVSRESLEETLEAFARELRAAYAPDLDLRELLREVGDPERRAAHAARASEVQLDPRAGYRPLSQRALLPLVAREVVDSGLDADRQALIELGETRERLTRELAAAESAIGLLDRVNVLTDSPEERERNRLQAELHEAEAQLRTRYEQVQQHVLRALSAFPPLEVYQRALEVLGVSSVLEPETTERLLADGHVGSVSRVQRRPLVYAALCRLHTAFARAFPGVPLRLQAAHTAIHDGEEGADSPQAELLAAAFARLETPGAHALRRRALEHAELLGGVIQSERQTLARISTLDWLVFWSDTEDEARLRVLRGRRGFHAQSVDATYRDLLGLCREGVRDLPPFALRDATLAFLAAIKEIHTDGGSSSSPRSCSVYGRGEARDAIRQARRVFEQHYGLRGSRQELYRAVAACEPPARQRPGGPFRPLGQQAVVELIAGGVGPDFAQRYDQVREQARQLRRLDGERQEVAEEISLWDRINVFSTTPEEQRNRELKQELSQLEGERAALALDLDRELDTALAAYPPGQLYYALGGLLSTLDAIRAVCRRHTRTTGSGKDRRTETYYTCALIGHGEAVRCARRWAQTFVHLFGDLPDYAGVLEQWELWRLGQLAAAQKKTSTPPSPT
ncbi:MAG: hypothetical protein R3F62_00170 [Planctomycetota bacterium]